MSAESHEPQSSFLSRRPWRLRKNTVSLGTENEIKTFYEAPESVLRSGSVQWVENAPVTLPGARKLRFDGAAIHVYKTIKDSVGVLGSTLQYKPKTVKLQSPHLRALLDPLLKPHGALSNEFEGVTEIETPFKSLFFERGKIIELAESSEGQVKDHLKLLISVIYDILGPVLDEVEDANVSGEISYDIIWTLFPSKELVVMTTGAAVGGGKVQEATYRSEDPGDLYFRIIVENVGYNGLYFGLHERRLYIDEYDGKKEIKALPVYPLRFHGDPADIRRRFSDRGERIVGFQTEKHALCASLEEDREDVSSKGGWDAFCEANRHLGRVMIDFASFERINPSSRQAIKQLPEYKQYGLSVFSEAHESSHIEGEREASQHHPLSRKGEHIAISTKIMLNNSEYLFMTIPELHGFAFSTNTWVTFHVDQISPITSTSDAWDHLVMNTRKKDIVCSLVENHGFSRISNEDVISGKGQGLFILLSGPPGSGKTLCAEAISEKAQRPLYSVHPENLSPGEGETIHTRLSEIMDRANEWKAVLLFDEADAFLRRQHLHDPKQDMVSAFLWHLEHHKGVVFLITNHPEYIDPAISSRAHLHIQFPELDKASRRLLWTRFLDRFPDLTGKFPDHELDDLAHWRLNGRQIRNTLSLLDRWTRQSKTTPSLEAAEDMIGMTCLNAVKEATNDETNEGKHMLNGTPEKSVTNDLVDLMG